MSSKRLMYDTCEYQTRLNESVGTLQYMLNPMRYENCNKCRMDLGVVGGTVLVVVVVVVAAVVISAGDSNDA